MSKLYFPASEVANLLGIDEDLVINFCAKNNSHKICRYNSKGQVTEYILPEGLVKKLSDKRKEFFATTLDGIDASEVQ